MEREVVDALDADDAAVVESWMILQVPYGRPGLARC